MGRRASLRPAMREPGDPVRAEAIELLACLASQSEEWLWWVKPFSLPGTWSADAVSEAGSALDDISVIDNLDLDWRELYAEAEARLREVARG